jgi:2-polyprenyl-3-methyl-5-hydroxy-6-metoxy-1,4-benzoquinol methylase
MDDKHYYKELAAAYVRGKCPELFDAGEEHLFEAAREKGLKLHRFKRTTGLPRVQKVIGALKSFAPATLLDIGSGRGVFLWALLDELPGVKVTAVDVLPYRVDDINAVHKGGFSRVKAECLSAEDLHWPDNSFDAVTVLEVLEHVADPAIVAGPVVRVARSVVIVSVPAREDNNPEHIHLFTRDSLTDLFVNAGAKNVRIEHVLNHMIAVVKP